MEGVSFHKKVGLLGSKILAKFEPNFNVAGKNSYYAAEISAYQEKLNIHSVKKTKKQNN